MAFIRVCNCPKVIISFIYTIFANFDPPPPSLLHSATTTCYIVHIELDGPALPYLGGMCIGYRLRERFLRQIVPAGINPRVLYAVVAVPWSLSDLETTWGIRGLESAPVLCTTPINVSKGLTTSHEALL